MKRVFLGLVIFLLIFIISGCATNGTVQGNESPTKVCPELYSECESYKVECDVIRVNGGTGYPDVIERCDQLSEICANQETLKANVVWGDTLLTNIKAQKIICKAMNEN